MINHKLTKANVFDGVDPNNQESYIYMQDQDLKNRIFFAAKHLFDMDFFFDPDNLSKFKVLLQLYTRKGYAEDQEQGNIRTPKADYQGIERLARSASTTKEKFFVLPEVLLSVNGDVILDDNTNEEPDDKFSQAYLADRYQ